MTAQLFQLLAQLDRPGATELVVATGRPVVVRVNATYHPLTAAAVTLPQLMHLIRDTLLVALVPSGEQVGDPVALELDGRALRAQFLRQGSDLLLRIEHRPQPPAAASVRRTQVRCFSDASSAADAMRLVISSTSRDCLAWYRAPAFVSTCTRT